MEEYEDTDEEEEEEERGDDDEEEVNVANVKETEEERVERRRNKRQVIWRLEMCEEMGRKRHLQQEIMKPKWFQLKHVRKVEMCCKRCPHENTATFGLDVCSQLGFLSLQDGCDVLVFPKVSPQTVYSAWNRLAEKVIESLIPRQRGRQRASYQADGMDR